MLNVTFSDYMRALLFSGVLFHWREFLNVKNVFRNWPKATLFKFGMINGFMGRLKNGEKVKIRNQWDYYRLLYAHMLNNVKIWGAIIKFKFKNKNLRFYSSANKSLLLDALKVLSETFTMEPYKQINAKGKVVVDIGSYIGDSPIYFILKGAKRVYAFEPYPSSYSLLLKNIKINSSDKKIIAFNEGLSKNMGKIRIKEDYEGLATSQLKDFHQGKQVKLTTLEGIVKRFNLKDAVLKMDCEGCEYTILKTPKKTLKSFQEIIMEYHYGYKDLREKLERASFKVKNTKPIRVNRLLMGYLHATPLMR
ncbi:MAG: FkbM family methyltransferase [Methanothermobacter tenebrarum]|nr:FkbM family methyltransferase [Methanobacteriaceae archaeon]